MVTTKPAAVAASKKRKAPAESSKTSKSKLAEHGFQLTSPLVNWSKCLCNVEPCLCAVKVSME